ncbi:MAG: hypothetical protein ABIP75_14335 [Pyrinomonadaceae bacterium]
MGRFESQMGRRARVVLFTVAAGVLLFVFSGPVAAQSRKKIVKYAVPRTAEIVSEANAPESAKPVERKVEAGAPAGSAYRTSLRDLVTLRETELNSALAQKTKMDELARDGLISRKALDEAAETIVEARAKLEDAKMRLASIDAYPTAVDEDIATQSEPEPTIAASASAPKSLLKKTTMIYPRGKRNATKRRTP